MPKETFLQLPLEKRERVLRAAAQVFAGQGFARTDVAQIARRAGVAKGSIYNYFENKEDLYLHVCRDGIERSRRAVYEGLKGEWDLDRKLEHIFRQGIAFALSHPEYIRLYLNVSSAGMEGFAEQLTLEVEKHTADYLKGLIGEAVRKGEVRPDVDVNLAAFVINSLYIMFLVSLISRHFQIRMKEYLEISGNLNEKNVEHHVQTVIALIRRVLMGDSDRGTGKKTRKGSSKEGERGNQWEP